MNLLDPPATPGMYPSLMADLIAIQGDPAQSVDLAHRHGFVGVDLRLARHVGWLENFGVEAFLELMRVYGVRAGYGSMLTRTLSANPDEWKHAVDQLPRVARMAQALGFTRAGVVVMPFDDGLDHPANRKRHLDRLREAAPVLADHGIRLGLEYVSPASRRRGAAFAFIHDLKGVLGLIDEAGQPNVGLMLDSFHWHCAQESKEDLLALSAERVVVVHINDAPAQTPMDELDVRERELPGATGVIDLPGFMSALHEIGYDGPVTAEPTHPVWPETDAQVAAARAAESVLRAVSWAR